MRPPILIL
jgi:hypothetical protein